MTNVCRSVVTAAMCALALGVSAATDVQTPPQPPQEKPAEKKPPVKRVRVDMAGFELGSPAPKTQLGGGTRALGGETTLAAPAVGRCYTDRPVLAWTHPAQVENFQVELFAEGGAAPIHRLRVSGRQAAVPDGHALKAGATLLWRAGPENTMVGRPSAKAEIRRLSAAELDDIAKQLKAPGPGISDPLEWRAQVFTDRRLWYDAVAAWTELVEKYPNRPELREKRGQIYDQLPATVPLADADFAAAEKLRGGAPSADR